MQERAAIEAGDVVVLYVDECHLIHDDARGYVWGKANEPSTIPMANFRDRQTYYGAIEQCCGEITCRPAAAGNGKETVAFLEYLRQKYIDKRLLLLWDGASYHKGEEMAAYLQRLNQDQDPAHWPITCVRFAPNAPEQNPMEDIWLKGKQYIRSQWWKCANFRQVKDLFLQALDGGRQVFDKLFAYAPFLAIS